MVTFGYGLVNCLAPHSRMVVLGGGPSAEGAGLLLRPDLETVIAVNHAIQRLPFAPHFWCTVNPERTIDLMLNPAWGCEYFAGVPESWKPIPWVTPLRREQISGLSDDPGALATGNSAYAALNLAYLMKATKVVLLGVDGGDNSGWHIDIWGRHKSLEHLPDLFASAVPQLSAAGIEVVNGSPDSRVTCFRRCTPQEALAWLRA